MPDRAHHYEAMAVLALGIPAIGALLIAITVNVLINTLRGQQ